MAITSKESLLGKLCTGVSKLTGTAVTRDHQLNGSSDRTVSGHRPGGREYKAGCQQGWLLPRAARENLLPACPRLLVV